MPSIPYAPSAIHGSGDHARSARPLRPRAGTALALCLALALAVALPCRAEAPKDATAGLAAPEALSQRTAANLGALAAMLDQNQRDIDTMIASRIDAIVERQRLAAEHQRGSEDDLLTFRKTRGAAIADSLTAMMRRGDRAALELGELDAMAATLRAELFANTVQPKYSTKQLEAAAKKLAQLAEKTSTVDRMREFAGYFKETKEATEVLHAEAKKQASEADKKTNAVAADAKKAADTKVAATP